MWVAWLSDCSKWFTCELQQLTARYGDERAVHGSRLTLHSGKTNKVHLNVPAAIDHLAQQHITYCNPLRLSVASGGGRRQGAWGKGQLQRQRQRQRHRSKGRSHRLNRATFHYRARWNKKCWRAAASWAQISSWSESDSQSQSQSRSRSRSQSRCNRQTVAHSAWTLLFLYFFLWLLLLSFIRQCRVCRQFEV